jgi:hypothetical protein
MDKPVFILVIMLVSSIAIGSIYVCMDSLSLSNPFVFAQNNKSSANVNSSLTATNATIANASTGPGPLSLTQNSAFLSNLRPSSNTTSSEYAPNIKALVLSKNVTSFENMTGNVSGKKGHKIIEDLGLLSEERSGTSGEPSNTSDTQFEQSEKSISEQESPVPEESTGNNVSAQSGETGPSSEPNKDGAQTESTTPSIAANTPLTIVSINPAKGATGVEVTSPITATFSKPIISSSVSTSVFTLRDSAGNSIPGAVTADSTAATATFTPSSPLAFSTLYVARVTTGVQDQDGNHLTSPKQWSFTTGAAPSPQCNGPCIPLTIVSINPDDGATGVEVTSLITATFSKPIISSSVSTSTFTLKDSAGNSIPGAVTADSTAAIATFTPSSPLAFSTSFTARVTTDVQDQDGNHLTSTKQWSFTTGAAPPPPCNPPCPKKPPRGISLPTLGSGQATTGGSGVPYPKFVHVTIKFLSIDVYDTHDYIGNGKYDLYAETGHGNHYVPYQSGYTDLLDLTEASVGLKLFDVGENERVYFEPDTESHLSYNSKDLTSAQPKIAFYVRVYGYEVDGCARDRNSGSHLPDSVLGGSKCLVDENDPLGEVKEIYEYSWPTTFGKQENIPVNIKSSAGDYNIKYQISLETETQACNAALASDPNIHHDECVPFLYPK